MPSPIGVCHYQTEAPMLSRLVKILLVIVLIPPAFIALILIVAYVYTLITGHAPPVPKF